MSGFFNKIKLKIGNPAILRPKERTHCNFDMKTFFLQYLVLACSLLIQMSQPSNSNQLLSQNL